MVPTPWPNSGPITLANDTIHPSPDAAAAFTEALNRPARVNERLAEALQRTAKFSWLD